MFSVWLLFEVCFVFFMFPETSGRTLEELAFRECPLPGILPFTNPIGYSLRARRDQTPPKTERRRRAARRCAWGGLLSRKSQVAFCGQGEYARD